MKALQESSTLQILGGNLGYEDHAGFMLTKDSTDEEYDLFTDYIFEQFQDKDEFKAMVKSIVDSLEPGCAICGWVVY